MSVQIIVGAQWGDEGKGKIVDHLSEKVDIVARYQGGANAGHTVLLPPVRGQSPRQFVLHLIPSGILPPTRHLRDRQRRRVGSCGADGRRRAT